MKIGANGLYGKDMKRSIFVGQEVKVKVTWSWT